MTRHIPTRVVTCSRSRSLSPSRVHTPLPTKLWNPPPHLACAPCTAYAAPPRGENARPMHASDRCTALWCADTVANLHNESDHAPHPGALSGDGRGGCRAATLAIPAALAVVAGVAAAGSATAAASATTRLRQPQTVPQQVQEAYLQIVHEDVQEREDVLEGGPQRASEVQVEEGEVQQGLQGGLQLVLLTPPLPRPRHSCVAATHTRSTIVSFVNEERSVWCAGQRHISGQG